MQPSHPNRPASPRERLANARLYLCTDARREKGDLAKFAEAAFAGGVDIIQLRDKGSPGEAKFGPLEARAELGALAELKAAPPPGRGRGHPLRQRGHFRVASPAPAHGIRAHHHIL